MSHKHSISSTQKKTSLKNHQIKQERKATHSLSKPMIYTSSPPLATSYQKVPRKHIVLNRRSGLIFRWWWSPDHSKDEGFRRRWSRRWSWSWSRCWSWRNWGCGWCWGGGSGVSNWHGRRPRTSWHSGKGMSGSPASPLLHIILELLHCRLNFRYFDIQVIELLFHDSL